MIRPVSLNDAEQICNIYNYYIAKTIITFEESAVSVEEMSERISQANDRKPWIVYEEEGEILGYAYASAWKSRCAYKHSVECTVYLDVNAKGRGIGSKLYATLIDSFKNTDIHTLIGGISLPNEGSIALHEKFGFEKIAQFKEVGYKFDQWIDVGYWQLILQK